MVLRTWRGRFQEYRTGHRPIRQVVRAPSCSSAFDGRGVRQSASATTNGSLSGGLCRRRIHAIRRAIRQQRCPDNNLIQRDPWFHSTLMVRRLETPRNRFAHGSSPRCEHPHAGWSLLAERSLAHTCGQVGERIAYATTNWKIRFSAITVCSTSSAVLKRPKEKRMLAPVWSG